MYLTFNIEEPDVDYLKLESYLVLAKQKRTSIEDLLSELQHKSERLDFVNNRTEWVDWLYTNTENITDFINDTGITIPNWYIVLYLNIYSSLIA